MRVIRGGLGTVALAAAVLATIPAPSHATPDATVRYGVAILDGAVVLSLRAGSVAPAAGGHGVDVFDSGGMRLETLPTAYTRDGVSYPVATRVGDDGRSLTLKPVETDPRPVAGALENQLALGDFATAMSVGPTVGLIAGTVLGAVIGAAVGASTCLVVGPGCVATLPAAIGAFAGAGGVVGGVVGGTAGLLAGGWKYLTTLQAAPGTSPYANSDGLQDPNGAGVPNSPLRLPGLPALPPTGSG
ncbi:hypothetical protein [Nocardia sp. NPDC005745]|uniref:hypothetical protein n=1 Tax=Nocardia sp. NPDC005745 TaxID=3157061 RepID=UPI0033D5CC93